MDHRVFTGQSMQNALRVHAVPNCVIESGISIFFYATITDDSKLCRNFQFKNHKIPTSPLYYSYSVPFPPRYIEQVLMLNSFLILSIRRGFRSICTMAIRMGHNLPQTDVY